MIEDSPGHVLYYNFMKALYREHPVRESGAGTVESIAKITANMLYDWHRVFYNPANMVLAVAGDVDPGRVASLAGGIFQNVEGILPERDYGSEKGQNPITTKTEAKMEVSAPMFLLGCKLEPLGQGRKFLKRRLVGRLAMRQLCGRSSALFSRLYEKGVINNDFSWELDSFPQGAVCSVEGESRKPELVLEEVQKEAALISKGADKELFERIKKSTYGSHIRGLNSFDNICYNLAEGHFKGYNAFDSFDILREITKEDIEAFLAENLIPERMALSIVRPKGS